MKVFIIGGGGREHTICHKLSQSPKVEKIYCAGINAGISDLAEMVDISTNDFDALIQFAKSNDIDLTIVSMDDMLVDGIVDEFQKNGLRIFGPNRRASIIEGSKAFSKKFMKKNNIPTAEYHVFSSYEGAIKYAEKSLYPIVIKADGLALGKGVFICESIEEAKKIIKDIIIDKKFGASGEAVIIEEFMTGKEVSVLCFCDGKTIVPMVSAQDHKRAYDGDLGGNTGGMGTISPSKHYTKSVSEEAMNKIFVPTMEALTSENRAFVGVLFFGLMITQSGIKVIEYNARFGDPEAQVVLPRLKTDLIDIIQACIDGKLQSIDIEWEECATSCVVLASKGYPNDYKKGYEITGLEEVKTIKDVYIYHAGTTIKDNKIVTNGGRVLGVMAKSDTVDMALAKSYEALKQVSFEGGFYRKDIGKN